MIIQATRISRKGGVDYLAHHLLDKPAENDLIEILAGDRAALYDAQALSQVKGCRYSIRHLSISPETEMSPAQLSAFLRSVDGEFGIGGDRPRLVVRHVKRGRAHFHVAIAEVDPVTSKVLDCRKDFARLEDLARRYEASHGESVQPSRAERREALIEGLSDAARKRAERTSPAFDRTRLKAAFAKGTATFHAELNAQGLRLAEGHKGAILVTDSGNFVAAANRVVGVKRSEFVLEIIRHETVPGSWTTPSGGPCQGREQHSEAAAAVVPTRNTRRPGPDRAVGGTARPYPERPAADRGGAQGSRRQDRSPAAALIRRRHPEERFLSQLAKLDLDDLLRRARELAAWMTYTFEPETSRLVRQIEEARRRKLFPPADTGKLAAPAYDFKRRRMP